MKTDMLYLLGQISQGNVREFYKSSIWANVRVNVLREQNYECQRCKQRGIYKKATVVHHKKYLRQYPYLAIQKDNLEALCDECHYAEHHTQELLNTEKW